MKKLLLVLVIALNAVGCGGGGGDAGGGGGSGGGSSYQTAGTNALSTKLNGASSVVAFNPIMDLFNTIAKALSPFNEAKALGSGLQGVYFGEIEVVAYNYRPGQAIQNHSAGGGFNGTDWSYWVVMQSGQTTSRDNLLPVGSALNIAALDPFPELPHAAFINSVQKFQVDVVEVYAYKTGVVDNNEFYGFSGGVDGAAGGDPLYKNLTYRGATQHNGRPVFQGITRGAPDIAGGAADDVSIMFVRNDWFPTPKIIILDANNVNDGNVNDTVITSPTVGLGAAQITQFQSDTIRSLVSQGSTRRFYHNLIIVPFTQFSGPLVVNFPIDSVIQPLGNTRLGGAIAAVNPTAWADDVQFNVMLKIDQSNIINEAMPGNIVNFNADGNNIPFGLDLQVSSK